MIKKLFLTSVLALTISMGFSQGFTAGNLVVYRYGDGSAYTNGQLVPVFLDEYTTAGVLVQSLGVPKVASGDNKGLTGLLKLSSTGTYQQEGISTLSQDGKYISIFGYNAAVGATVPSAADGLVVGVIAADGSINTRTTLSSDPTTGLGSPRSAIIDGTNIWAHGFNNGVQYTTLNATSSTRVSVDQNAPTTLSIFDNNLVAPLGANGGLPFLTPLPTTQQAFTVRGGVGVGKAINQVVEFTFSDRKIMYSVDDVNNEIRRYNTNAGGNDWIIRRTIPVTETSLIKSITGVKTISGANTVFTLYITSWGDDGTGAGTSKLYTFSESIVTQASGGVNDAGTVTPLTLLATAPAGTVFRSVTWAPQGSTAIGTGVLPISLESFNGQKKDDAIQLNWVTASEQNNSHFNILRSLDGKKFSAIGKVNGNGNSTTSLNYSFLDLSPLSGTNYYQLEQVDFDGKSSTSEIIAVKSGIKSTEMTIYSAPNQLKVNVLSGNVTTAVINIYSVGGKVMLSQTIKLNKGYNNIELPVSLDSGIFVATLQTPSETISKKFKN
ncbi:MAG TPA: T9SS type A sorting domain-containing protein [Pelobium sp.]|nr:T9SS type A sorting domain-containing protein [Pelobium sp.]